MSERTGRILALDLGDARIGLALSDPLGITAQPAGVIERSGSRKDIEKIRALAASERVVLVLVGHPLLMSGEAGERARRAEEVAEQLRATLGNTPVRLWDERLTTVQAERAMIEGNVRRRRRRKSVDAIAAALILQSYMDARRGDGE